MSVPGRWTAWLAVMAVTGLAGVGATLGALDTPAHPPPATVAYGESSLGPTFPRPAPCPSTPAPGAAGPAALATVQKEIEAELRPEAGLGIGLGASTVSLSLPAGQEAAAARVRARYGAAVTITVGHTPYCGGPGRSPTCAPLPPPRPLPDGLALQVVLSPGVIRSGRDGSGRLIATDTGSDDYRLGLGEPLVGFVVRSTDRRVVGAPGDAYVGTGYGVLLRPGHSVSFPFVFGTTRCDGGAGSVLPAGRYAVVVGIVPGAGATGVPRSAQYSPPAPLRVRS